MSPIGAVDVVRAISGLFSAPDAKPVGRVVAVVGAKGGVGASTIAHNISWAIAEDIGLSSVVADLDLAFGTAGLDFNQDPPQGIADAVYSPDRIDTAFIDRLLSKVHGAPELACVPGHAGSGTMISMLRPSIPSSIFSDRAFPASFLMFLISGPHGVAAFLVGADDILVVAAPDLANLRNAKRSSRSVARGATRTTAIRFTV